MDSEARQQYIQELKSLRSELMAQYRKSEDGEGDGEASPHSANSSLGSLTQSYERMGNESSYSSGMLNDMRSTIASQYNSGSGNSPTQAESYSESGASTGYENSGGRSR